MNKLLTVSQLNNYIKGVFEDELILHDVSVTGEIFEFKTGAGHSYIVLREGDCILNCVLFSSSVPYEAGIKVCVTGSVKYYPKGGKLSFVAKNIKICGEGEILARQAAIKNKLLAEGVFANNRPLKRLVCHIALITSGEGAVRYDFRSVLSASAPYADCCVFCVKVQGKGASGKIISTMSDINSGLYGEFDIIVIARGGGSVTDLSEFNNENLARAVAASPIPVISAVGHETDYTLCDYAADHRAGTPSIAAEMIVKNNKAFFADYFSLVNGIQARLGDMFARQNRKLFKVSIRAIDGISLIFDKAHRELRRFSDRLKASADSLVVNRRKKMRVPCNSGHTTLWGNLGEKDARFKVLCAQTDNASPLKILSKGYGRIKKHGIPVKQVDEVCKDDNIDVLMSDGEIGARVFEVRKRY